MKIRVFLVCLFIGFISLSVGCQTAQNPTTTTSTSGVPESVAASSVAQLATNSAGSAATGGAFMGISSLGIKPLSGAPSVAPESDGWWAIGYSSSVEGLSVVYDMKLKMWGKTLGVLDSFTKLATLKSGGDTLDKMWIYSTITVTSSEGTATLTMGSSKTNPLQAENLKTASQTLNGPASFAGIYLGTSFSISINYVNLSVGTGYPSGSVSFTITSASSVLYSGTVTFNGTSTATIVFTGGGTYTVNLATGAATPASL